MMNELKEKAIKNLVFNFADSLGVRKMNGGEEWYIYIKAIHDLFGDEVYKEIIEEVEKRVR